VRYAAVVAVVARWWNGRFGRMARGDVRLVEQAGCWTVEIVEGGSEGGSTSWDYTSEAEARAFVARCLETGGDGWRELRA